MNTICYFRLCFTITLNAENGWYFIKSKLYDRGSDRYFVVIILIEAFYNT